MGLETLLHVRIALGQHEVPFKMYKLRTMSPNAQCEFSQVLAENGVDGLGHIINDPRITKWGKYLRKYGLDELPQIYNLLRREMTLVGIRPRNAQAWSMRPEMLKKHALQYKPGWLSPAYSVLGIENFDRLIEVETQYLQQKDAAPFKTDVQYLCRILYNFVFRGLRSS